MYYSSIGAPLRQSIDLLQVHNRKLTVRRSSEVDFFISMRENHFDYWPDRPLFKGLIDAKEAHLWTRVHLLHAKRGP